METKEQPLNIKNVNEELSNKMKNNSKLTKKEQNKIKNYYIIVFVIFALVFCSVCYSIYKNLTTLSELKKVLKKGEKEVEDSDKTRLELIEKIDSVEKQIELKKRYIKEKREFEGQKLDEYNIERKKYEDLEAIQNQIIEENKSSLNLEEAISNLNNRIHNLE